MSTPAEIREKLEAARAAGELITAKVPGTKDLALSMQRHMVEQAKRRWQIEVPEHARMATLRNLRRSLERGGKRVAKGRAKKNDCDGLHADMALWLAYEALYGTGIEQHLVADPTREELQKPSPQELH